MALAAATTSTATRREHATASLTPRCHACGPLATRPKDRSARWRPTASNARSRRRRHLLYHRRLPPVCHLQRQASAAMSARSRSSPMAVVTMVGWARSLKSAPTAPIVPTAESDWRRRLRGNPTPRRPRKHRHHLGCAPTRARSQGTGNATMAGLAPNLANANSVQTAMTAGAATSHRRRQCRCRPAYPRRHRPSPIRRRSHCRHPCCRPPPRVFHQALRHSRRSPPADLSRCRCPRHIPFPMPRPRCLHRRCRLRPRPRRWHPCPGCRPTPRPLRPHSCQPFQRRRCHPRCLRSPLRQPRR